MIPFLSALIFLTKTGLRAGAWLVLTPARAHACNTHSLLVFHKKVIGLRQLIVKKKKKKVENKKKLLKLLKKKLYFTVFI